MFISVKFKDCVPFILALILIAVSFMLRDIEDEVAAYVPTMAEQGPVLIIDAGHGGEDGGTTSAGGLVESGVNLEISKKLEAIAKLFGVETVMTRTSQTIDYPEDATTIAKRKLADQKARIALINSYSNAILISVHQNSYPAPQPSGSQVLYGTKDGSLELGELTHENMTSVLCPGNRRVASPISDTIFLMRSVNCTAILVECGFLSNVAEAELLNTSTYQTKIATVLLGSYLQYKVQSYGMVT